MDARTARLLQAPIGSTLLLLAAPNVLVMLVQASIGLIETYFVAALGTDALAGMALVFPLLMLVQMISAGAMGGGILSAVARALGGGRLLDAQMLVWHAVYVALALGALTTVAALLGGPPLYAAMGGNAGSLEAATLYSGVVFSGAVLIWLFNSLAAVIRATGNMVLPAAVVCVGALVIIPLSPALIFGFGVIPELGIAGGGVAILIFYAAGAAVFAAYLWSGRGVLVPPLRPSRPRLPALGDIMRVGAVSSLVSATTNVTVAVATGFAGVFGAAAVAGYGAGARLEYLLVPLVFGLGAPIGAMVGTAIGAGDRRRALKVAWVGAGIAGVMAEAIGLAAALAPTHWLGLFGDDPGMLAAGSSYLRIVGPFYGFFGAGLALYFASQGAARVGWPLAGGVLRMAVAIGGGWAALRLGLGIEGVYAALAAGLVAMGVVNAAAIAAGVWFPDRAAPRPATVG